MTKIVSLICLTFVLATNAALAGDVTLQLVQADGKKSTEHKAAVGGIVLLRVSVQNLTSSPITVGYLGAGSGAFMVKIPDRNIDPTMEGLFTVLINNDLLGVASNVDIAVGYTIGGQLKTARSIVSLSSTDILTFTPGFLTWKVGAAADEKMATISLPQNTRIVSAPTIDGFNIRLDGNNIYVKPTQTGTPITAGVFLKTAPPMQTNRILPLGLSIAP